VTLSAQSNEVASSRSSKGTGLALWSEGAQGVVTVDRERHQRGG